MFTGISLYINDTVKGIEKYRSVLMGLAILSVLKSHLFTFVNHEHDSFFELVLDKFPAIVFTQGFLFLSGFGLYYSYTNNNNIKEFYKKRVKRLLVPFLIISSPFFICFHYLGIENTNLGCFEIILRATSLSFWIEGNYFGMWYIALSVVLYLFFPFIYKYIFRCRKFSSITLGTIATVVLFFCFHLFIFKFFPLYYGKIGVALEKITIFPVGMYFGYLCKNNISHIPVVAIVTITFCSCFYILSSHSSFLYCYRVICQQILTIFFVCFSFCLVKQSKAVDQFVIFLAWFGKYSLELYILHLLLYPLILYMGGQKKCLYILLKLFL